MSKFFVTFCLLAILQAQPIFAQGTRADSLIKTLDGLDANQKYSSLLEVVREYARIGKNEDALIYCSQARDLSIGLRDSTLIVESSRMQGQLLNRLDRHREAADILELILPVAKRNSYINDYKLILNNLAIAYTFQAKYDEALKIHFENLVLREADGDKFETSVSLNNIGLVYFKLKNYERALSYYLRARSLRLESGKTMDLERLHINIGLCYNQLKQFENAKKNFDDGFLACTNNCSPQLEIEGNFGLGVASYGLQDHKGAADYFNKSLAIAERIGNKRFQAENLVYLAHIDVKLGNFESAIESLKTCESIARSGQFNELLIETYKEFFNVFNKKNDHESASIYQQRYINLKDSIYSERLIDNIAKVQTDYAERENIKTIASKETVIQQQRDLNVAIAVIAILAGLLILVLQRSNRISKQVNAQLSEAKATIQDQNKLLEIKNKDLDREVEKKTVDLERVNLSLKQVNDELDNFIYKTSHDIRGPLASLKGMCNVALLDVKDPIALDYLKKLDATAERLNSILTRLLIINQINNSKLSVSRIDFTRIVEDVLMLEKKRGLPTKLEIRKNIDLSVQMFSDRELVRIVLENLIDNAIKFYNDSDRVDSFVDVSIIPEGTASVKVRVVDNGIGISEANPGKLFQMFFRASERSEIGGIGLYIVKTATAKIGGKVGLLTTPEGYTEFYVVLPLNPPSANDEWPDKPHL